MTAQDVTTALPPPGDFSTVEALVRTLSGQASIGIFLSDPEGRTLYLNERLRRIAGLPVVPTPGECWRNALAPEDHDPICSEWSGATNAERSFSREFRFRRPDGSLRWGLLALFRFPTGPNAYTQERWRNLALGNNELKLGPVAQYEAGPFVLHANLFWIFREKDREGFYNGIYLNPAKKETYSKVLGLNFAADGAFLNGDRLANDYAAGSLALNTDAVYPLIPWVSVYASRRFARVGGEDKRIPVEGMGVNPLLFSAGGRYFFSYNAFAGISTTVSAVRKRHYPGETIGLELRLQF